MVKDLLIIEDRELEREHLHKLFAKRGYNVSAAASRKDAEELLAEHQFRLALIDLGLTDSSGSVVFDLVSNSERIDFTVILTGNPSPHLKKRFLDNGASAYIIKGTNSASSQELLQQIQSILGGPLAREES